MPAFRVMTMSNPLGGELVLRHVDETTAGDLPQWQWSRVFTEAHLDAMPLIVAAALGLAYLAGVRQLRRRGDSWSPARIFSFLVVGVGGFLVATSSGLAGYDRILLSVHMVQHMILAMVVPLGLALGAPVTLALRTLPAPPRGALLALLHSRVATVLTFAPLTFLVFVLTPWVLYFSGWYEASLRSPFVHDMTHVHMIVVGAAFLWPQVGLDPVPGRVSYPFRMLLMLLTLPFHAFLGVTMGGQSTLLAGDWYRSLDLSWSPDFFADQRLAGGILWGTGDVVGLVFFGVFFFQWVRSAAKEAAREDRRLDLLEAKQRRYQQAAPPNEVDR